MHFAKRCKGFIPISLHPARIGRRDLFRPVLIFFFLFALPTDIFAMTAQEILDQVGKQNFSDNFRGYVTVKTFKGKKLISNHSLWLTVRVDNGNSSFFVDFEQPKESKGLRFLFLEEPGKEPSAFMYLPATDKIVPLDVDDPSVDVGGTGLTTEDLQGFIQKTSSEAELLREEKVDGRDCYVIRMPNPETKGERLLWISKAGFLVLKNQQLDAQGKILRTFKVTELFKTDQGKEFPRQEEIAVPAKGVHIDIRQENAVFGIEIPEEIMNPDKFGTYQWKG